MELGEITEIEVLDQFNRQRALERVGGDEDLFREIAQLYMVEYPALLGQIEGAVADANANALQHSAHTLKGSLSALGAELAAESALRIEILARRGNLAGCPEALIALRHNLDSFHSLLGPEVS